MAEGEAPPDALLAHLDRVLFTLDAHPRRVRFVSRTAERVLGHAAERIARDPSLWRSLLHPVEVEQRDGDLLTGRGVRHRWQADLPDRPGRWLEAMVRGETDADGRLHAVHGWVADVTEEQRARDEVGERNKELMTLYRISEVTFTATSPEQAYEDILEEIAKATGFPIVAIEQYDPVRDRLVILAARGIPLPDGPLELSPDETLSGMAARTGRPVIATDAGRRPELAHPVLRDAGIETYLAFPLVSGQQVLGTLAVAHTRPVEPERRMVRWTGTLAHGVSQLVDRFASADALRESERESRSLVEQLKQANQELESFAYSVSHDLRAPLRTMQGFAHALLQNHADALSPEARDFIQRIIASGRQAEVLIRDLLAYSRLSVEQLELQPVALAEAVATARDQVEQDVREAGAEVTVVGDLPAVMGQSTILVQVIANLLSNAVKFGRMGVQPRIRIQSEEKGRTVRLWVEDNGIGIPPGQEERIFRVFERLEGGVRPGTGIGLAVVRRGMERMAGRAGVERRTGEDGSRFWIELPLVENSRRRPWGRRRRNR